MQRKLNNNTNNKTYIENDKFANFLGLELMTVSLDYTCSRLAIDGRHMNGLGTLHGAVVFAVADITFAAACNASDVTAIGIQAEIRYLKKAKGDSITCEAHLISSSKNLSHYQVKISDESNTIIATFSATAYKL